MWRASVSSVTRLCSLSWHLCMCESPPSKWATSLVCGFSDFVFPSCLSSSSVCIRIFPPESCPARRDQAEYLPIPGATVLLSSCLTWVLYFGSHVRSSWISLPLLETFLEWAPLRRIPQTLLGLLEFSLSVSTGLQSHWKPVFWLLFVKNINFLNVFFFYGSPVR